MKWLNCYRKKIVLVVIVAGMVLGSGSVKADFTWARKADMPTPRWSPTSAVVNGKIYVIGGGESEPSDRVLSTVEEYDPIIDTWTTKADMPTARGWTSPSSAVVDGKIYVIGGWDGNKMISTVEEYDPANDTWIQKADMPTRREDIGACMINGKIYAIGGYSPGAWVGLKTMEVYDPGTDTWTRKADMPLGVGMLNARVVNGRIYAIGGRPDLRARSYMHEYDPATDTWMRKSDMPLLTSQMASVVLGDKIIVMGGWLWSMNYPYTKVQVYDPETDLWSREADVPFRRAAFVAEVVNNRIYAIGGTDRPHPCPALSTNYEFGPMVDFDWDGFVDIDDLVILIEYWGTDEPLCDIAPFPDGDGIVDILDLEVFIKYWEQENMPQETDDEE